MITEIAILALTNYAIYRYGTRESRQFKKDFDYIMERLPELSNNMKESPKLIDYQKEQYGYKVKFLLPMGVSTDTLAEKMLEILEALDIKSIHIENENRLITLYCINEYPFTTYQPMKLKPWQLVCGEFLGKPKVTDMTKYPHVLIGGDTNMGKTRLLFTILTNLINNSNQVELFLLQIRKNDLIVFKNCKQVKCMSQTLEEVRDTLRAIDEDLRHREEIIDMEQGYLNIQEYNAKSGKKLKYRYVVIEEFSFLNVSKADAKEEKEMKNECLKILKGIVNAGRSSGVYLIISLQKPTADSIPSDIKSMLTTRIAMRIKDAPVSKVIMGDTSATMLQLREFVINTGELEKGFSYTIDFEEIKKYTERYRVIRKPEQIEEPKVIDIAKALGL